MGTSWTYSMMDRVSDPILANFGSRALYIERKEILKDF